MGVRMRGMRTVPIAAAVLFALILMAAPAFGEGYNADREITSQMGWGSLSGNPALRYQPEGYKELTGPMEYSFSPHGGYTTTTNKCADCHSTHYAVGSYMLLRANSREAACDFCHGGGGGSNKNIMMDNAYTTSAAEMVATLGPAADATTTSGFGTGHTLGFTGNAPVDIRPAFSEPDGLACFNCHTPHGNTQRVLTTFYDPGHEVMATWPLKYSVHLRFDTEVDGTIDPVEVYVQEYTGIGPDIADVEIWPPDRQGDAPILADDGSGGEYAIYDNGWLYAWSIDEVDGNIVAKYNLALHGLGYGEIVEKKPIFPTGRFLLIKNPDDENGSGSAGDLDVATTDIDGVETVTDGSNKMAIDWENPLGVATSWYPPDDYYSYGMYQTSGTERTPYPMWYTGLDEARPGVATTSEFCVDCHDGAAGLSSQAAEVWAPSGVGLGLGASSVGTYTVAYGHDSHARGCDRQLYLNPDDANNFGPHCRQCHSGAGSCQQCHADPTYDLPTNALDPSAYGTDVLTEGVSVFVAQPFRKNVRPEVATVVGNACMDGGFSYPHRTLGANMLKDALYGIDFDGTPLAPGARRGAGLTPATLPGGSPLGLRGSYRIEALVDAVTENLDSTCLDCHNPNIWNGSDPSYETSFTANNVFYEIGYRTDGTVPNWTITGWDVLLRGLP